MDTIEDTTTEDTTTTNGKAKGKKEGEGTRRSYTMMDPNDLVVIGLDTKDGPEHALYDVRIKLPLDEMLVRNIQAYGVLEPVLAVKDGDTFQVVAGRRRVLHAREAAKRQEAAGEVVLKVPVLTKRGEDTYLFGIARSENGMRVNDGALTNARNAQRMLDMGATEQEIAIAFGVKTGAIKEWLTLLGLAPKVRTAVEKGVLSASAAVGLAKLPKEEQETHLEQLLLEGAKPTAETVINKVRVAKGKAPTVTPKTRIDKAEGIIYKALEAGLNKMTKDELVDTIDKLSKALLSKGLGKLQAEIDKEAEKAAEADEE